MSQSALGKNRAPGKASAMDDNKRRWIAENLILGAKPEVIADALGRQGFSKKTIEAEIAAASSSPYLLGVQRAAARLRKRDWLLRTYEEHRRLLPNAAEIPRRTGISKDEFLEKYYAAHLPVILTDLVSDWPAMTRWSLDYFEEKIGGDTEIELQFGRDQAEDYEIRNDDFKRRLPFKTYLSMLRRGERTNNYYCTANNGSYNRGVFDPLWEDIRPLPDFLEPNAAHDGFFWLGPPGTVTPFHHDLTNNLLVQVIGRKRLLIASSYQTPDMRNHRHVYSHWTGKDFAPDAPAAPGKPRLIECMLEPGEAIFLPIGWWHYVEGLDMTVSLSFTNFIWRNDFSKSYTEYGSL